jgi:ABC transporter DrrB family efflux protein
MSTPAETHEGGRDMPAGTRQPSGAPTATIDDAHPLYWLVRDTWSVTKRNLRHYVRQPRLLLFSTIQPVMFVLLFSFVFDGVVSADLPSGVTYINFLLPGILIHSSAFRTVQTAVGLGEDLERGVVDRFRSMPMARSAVLSGRTMADLLRSLAVLTLMIAIGYLIGFRFTQGPLQALGAIAVVALFGYALSWIFTYIAMVVPGAEAVQAAGFVAIFPLVFASSVFVPVATMPGWLATIVSYNPVTLGADAARVLAIGYLPDAYDSALEPITWTVLVCGVILAVFVPLAVRRYRRMT